MTELSGSCGDNRDDDGDDGSALKRDEMEIPFDVPHSTGSISKNV